MYKLPFDTTQKESYGYLFKPKTQAASGVKQRYHFLQCWYFLTPLQWGSLGAHGADGNPHWMPFGLFRRCFQNVQAVIATKLINIGTATDHCSE